MNSTKCLIIATICLHGFISEAYGAILAESCSLSKWSAFKSRYSKFYANSNEDFKRRVSFCNSLDRITKHNLLAGRKVLGINHMSDWTQDEFNAILMNDHEHNNLITMLESNNMIRSVKDKEANLLLNLSDNIPDAIDYRNDKRVVTRVKNQKRCGSCWAFAHTALMESMLHKWDPSIEEAESLSEQQLVDCATDHGCDGGNAYDTYAYLKKVGGQMSASDYPYYGFVRLCQLNNSLIVPATSKFTGFLKLEGKNEDLMKKIVAQYGPIAVSIQVGNVFRYIKPGEIVVDPDECVGEETRHAVLVVGYDTTKDGRDYWIIKNSWGADWGDEGYVWMARNANNSCQIAKRPYILF